MQRVHQPGTLAALFGQLLGKGFLPLGHNVLTGLLSGVLDILGAGGRSQVIRHLLGHSAVLTDQVCRAAQLVAVGQPQKIEQQ